MIQIFTDGVLAYDSRLEEYDLLGLRVTTGLNKGGTAEIVMPATHPAYDLFTPYRTIVEIYRDGDLRFRGRALYPTDDFTNTRTVTCEGELCFLQDYSSGPYSSTVRPRDKFTALIYMYNYTVEPFKHFSVGEIDVPSTYDDLLLESEEPESLLELVTKMLEICGGYIVFTTNAEGKRVINWRAAVGSENPQAIELGENLFDFGRTQMNTELCTAVIPYGAKDDLTGKRLDITEANNGSDILRDEDAIALRGTIMKALVWDEVTDPFVLKVLAQQYLDEHKNIIDSLTISALDLSYIDKSIESFKLGDRIRVISKAHGLDERFQLTELTEDLLNPAQSRITMGKDIKTLTGLDVAGDAKSQRAVRSAVAQVRSGYKATTNQATAALVDEIKRLEDRLAALESK